MAHNFTWENDGVYWRFNGVLTTPDLIIANSELIGHKSFDSIKYIIWDATEIDTANVDEIAVEISTTFAVTVNPYNPFVKVALLARDKHLRDLIEQYIDLTLEQVPHAQQKLFENISDARAWVSS